MGMEHIANISHIDGASVTALADVNPSSLDMARQAVPEAQTFTSARSLLEADLCDAVVIATPNHTHVDVLIEALATDIHILTEKPLCTTVEDCRSVISAAAARTAVTWVGLEYRYMPPVTRLIQEVRAGTVGDLKMISIREHRFPFLQKVDDWNRFNRNTGGTLVEKCCHFFDLMSEMAGAEPVRVFASGSQAVNHLDETYGDETPDILDNAFVIVEYDNGVRGVLDLCMFAEATHEQEELVAVGDGGKIEAMLPSMTLRIGRRGQHFIGDVDTEHVHDDRIRFQGHHHGSSYLEHLDFIDTCKTGRPAAVSLEDGLRAVAVGVAAHRSISTGLPVAMADVMLPSSAR